MHIIGSIVLACQSQKQLMLWAFMPFLTKNGWFFGYFFRKAVAVTCLLQ